MISVLLFDSDGVLAHTEALFFEINSNCFTELGIPYTREDFENHSFITNLGTTGFMEQLGYSPEQIKRFRERRNLLWQEVVTKTNTVDPDAETVIEQLATNFTLGIVTNTNTANFQKTYHDSRIPAVVDFVVHREDYEKGKPEPDSYLTALRIAGCTNEEALVIEDSPRGIIAAQAAGIKTIGVPNPVIKNLDISHADYQIPSLGALPDFLIYSSDQVIKQAHPSLS